MGDLGAHQLILRVAAGLGLLWLPALYRSAGALDAAVADVAAHRSTGNNPESGESGEKPSRILASAPPDAALPRSPVSATCASAADELTRGGAAPPERSQFGAVATYASLAELIQGADASAESARADRLRPGRPSDIAALLRVLPRTGPPQS